MIRVIVLDFFIQDLSEVKILKDIPGSTYLKALPVVRNLRKRGGIRFAKNVTFLVGENGDILDITSASCFFRRMQENRGL